MRTTIEIPDRLRAALLAMSAKRGMRGFSKIVEEAIDLYVKSQAEFDSDLADLLRLKGSWSRKDADEARRSVQDVRSNWRRREESHSREKRES